MLHRHFFVLLFVLVVGCEPQFRTQLRELNSVLRKHELHVNIASRDAASGELLATVNVPPGMFDKSLAEELVHCRGLVTLNLSGANLTYDQVKSISNYPDLKELKVSRTNLSRKQMIQLLKTDKLERLDVSFCTNVSEDLIRKLDFSQSKLLILHAQGIAKARFSVGEIMVDNEELKMYFESPVGIE